MSETAREPNTSQDFIFILCASFVLGTIYQRLLLGALDVLDIFLGLLISISFSFAFTEPSGIKSRSHFWFGCFAVIVFLAHLLFASGSDLFLRDKLLLSIRRENGNYVAEMKKDEYVSVREYLSGKVYPKAVEAEIYLSVGYTPLTTEAPSELKVRRVDRQYLMARRKMGGRDFDHIPVNDEYVVLYNVVLNPNSKKLREYGESGRFYPLDEEIKSVTDAIADSLAIEVKKLSLLSPSGTTDIPWWADSQGARQRKLYNALNSIELLNAIGPQWVSEVLEGRVTMLELASKSPTLELRAVFSQ